MCKFIMLTVALVAAFSLRAQSLEAFKQQLARPVVSEAAFGTARVSVREADDAARAVRELSRNETQLRFRGYRVCIFFDNTQNGRQLANEALNTFKEQFPGIPGEVVYTSPTFKTMVGYLLAMNEASMLLGRVREFFPGAVIEHGSEIKIEDLINSSVIAQPTDSLSTQPAAIEEL